MAEPRIVILGAGPAGVGAAYQLRRRGRAQVTVLEQNPVVGGNAGSFEAGASGWTTAAIGCTPPASRNSSPTFARCWEMTARSSPPRADQSPWEDDSLSAQAGRLVSQARQGLCRRHYPRHGRQGVAENGAEGDSFASVLMANLGPTICHDFYFPYAWKIWGRDPETLSGIQARRRVSAGSSAS
jgi:glycine/D-amino acid oxidase-like deaminating enzyme